MTLSISISISIFSKMTLLISISIFSKMTLSISIFFKSVNISTIYISYRYIERGYLEVLESSWKSLKVLFAQMFVLRRKNYFCEKFKLRPVWTKGSTLEPKLLFKWTLVARGGDWKGQSPFEQHFWFQGASLKQTLRTGFLIFSPSFISFFPQKIPIFLRSSDSFVQNFTIFRWKSVEKQDFMPCMAPYFRAGRAQLVGGPCETYTIPL